jgi:hypothetical protein
MLEARPVYGYLRSQWLNAPMAPTEMYLGFGLAMTLCLTATLVPIRIALRRLDAIER